jgi:hypothetical protein
VAKSDTKFENQARLSVILAACATLFMLAELFGVLTKFNFSDFEIVMRAGGVRFWGIIGSAALAIGLGAGGGLLAYSSIHQRNKKNGLSWAGFFFNAAVVGVAMCVFVFFWFTRETLKV